METHLMKLIGKMFKQENPNLDVLGEEQGLNGQIQSMMLKPFLVK